MKALRQLLFLFFCITIAPTYSQNHSDASWQRLNSPMAASIRSFTESKDQHFYAGTIAGVYKSTDKGASWKPIGLDDKVIDAVLITNKGTLLAGTYRSGIYRSEDQGKTWNITGAKENVYIFNIIQTDDKTIFSTAAYIIHGFPETSFTGVLKSTDDGKSWQATALNDNNIIALSNPKPGLLIASGKSKYYRSLDNGNTWSPGTKGLPDSIPVSSVINCDKTLFASVGHREVVDVITGGGIFRSDDNGLSWVRSDSGIDSNTKVNGIVSDEKTLYAATGFYGREGKNGIYKSTDKGRTWFPSGINKQPLRFINITSEKFLIAGTDGSALFISKDHGKKWKQSGKGIDDWVSFTVVKDNKNNLFSSGWESGLWKSSDNGNNWKQILENHMGLTVFPNGRLLTFYQNHILASNDHGDTWKKISEFKGGLVFLQYMNDSLILACSDHGLYYSKDSGNSWNKYDLGRMSEAHFRTAIITPDGTMLTGYRIGQQEVGILRSVDGGKTWTKVNDGLHVWAFLNHEGKIYAGNYGQGMYVSSDDGFTWTSCNNKLRKNDEYITVTAIIATKDKNIYCSTLGNGAFKSADNGITWETYNTGLTNFNNFGIYNDENDTLFISSFKGIFKRK